MVLHVFAGPVGCRHIVGTQHEQTAMATLTGSLHRADCQDTAPGRKGLEDVYTHVCACMSGLCVCEHVLMLMGECVHVVVLCVHARGV